MVIENQTYHSLHGGSAMKNNESNNDWLVSIFVGVVLSIIVIAFLATRLAGG
jgi:hypothetical protein